MADVDLMRRLAIIAAIALACGPASALDYPNELLLTLPQSLHGTQARLGLGGGATAITGAFGYNYSVTPDIQLGIFPVLAYISTSAGSGTGISVLAGPTFNLPLARGLGDAILLRGNLGFVYTSGSTGGTNFAFSFGLGKRFEIFDHVTYQPTFDVVWVTGQGRGASFVFNLFSFSLMF